MFRSSFHDIHLTRWFLVHGADPNRRCDRNKDCTPLSIAFLNAEFEIIQLLLDHGASLRQGQVMHYAAMRELDDRLEVLRYLIAKGTPVNDIMYQNCGDEYYYHMYSGIATPLHYAAGKGLLDSVKVLVDGGALPSIKDPSGRTAAEWAQMNDHISVVEFLHSLSTGDDFRQFTDAPGNHFRAVRLETLLTETGLKLV